METAEDETGRLNSYGGWSQASEISLIRTVSYSLYARLRSIEWDAQRILRLHEKIAPSLPLFGNERTGSWYVPPTYQLCRFRSNDGHYNQWRVSIRCLNLPLLREAIRYKGALVVDATRSGKTWPDALSKTLPLWCAVVSAVAAGVCEEEEEKLQSYLYLHPDVPPSEESAIRSRLPGFLQEWREAGVDFSRHVADFSVLKETMLRPVWIRADAVADSIHWDETYVPSCTSLGFIPLVCLSASLPLRQHSESDLLSPPEPSRAFIEAGYPDVEGEEVVVSGVIFPPRRNGFSYVQGAGDDQEAWSHGLSPELFWENRCQLLEFSRTRENWATNDSRWSHEMDKLLKREDIKTVERPVLGAGDKVTQSDILSESNIDIVAATPKSILRLVDNLSASNSIVEPRAKGDFVSSDLFICLSYSQVKAAAWNGGNSEEVPGVCETKNAHRPDSETTRSARTHWYCMADSRGKPDIKGALLRILDDALALMNSSQRTTILCDRGQGDWAAGLAIAYIAQRLSRERMLVREKGDNYPGADTKVSKDMVRRLVLRLAVDRGDLEVSRRTLQQVHTYFMAPRN